MFLLLDQIRATDIANRALLAKVYKNSEHLLGDRLRLGVMGLGFGDVC